MGKLKNRFPLASSFALATILITAASAALTMLLYLFTDKDCFGGIEEACNTPGVLIIPFLIGVWGTALAYSVLFPATVVIFVYELVKSKKKPKTNKKKKK